MNCFLNREGYSVATDRVYRPDGACIVLRAAHPLVTARRLVQEDLLIHHEMNGRYHLTGGALAFPASWSLSEKVGRDLAGVHAPVRVYDADLEKRVERLFFGLRPGVGLMRANYLTYSDPDLFQPRGENDRRDRKGVKRFIRVERQCLLKLPMTQAVVFTLHTYVVPMERLPLDAVAALPQEFPA